MSQRIICSCIVPGVKPYQLIAGLMAAQGLGPHPLAHRMKRPELQPPIHRFTNGDVKNPKVTTAQPLADYFRLPLEALYDEKVATRIAAERGIKEPPARSPRRPRKPESGGAAELAEKFAAMSPDAQREALRLIGIKVNPSQARESPTPAPPAQSETTPSNVRPLGAPQESGAGGLRKTGHQKRRPLPQPTTRKDEEK